MGATAVMTAVCEIGPVLIQRFACGTAASAVGDPLLAAAALDGGDGRFVLVEDRPLPLREVWQAVLGPLLNGADRAVLIHPSWWPAPRINAVQEAVGELVRDIDVLPRWRVWTHPHQGGAVVIEIAPEVVVVLGDGAPIAVQARTAAADLVAQEIADIVITRRVDRPVIIDAPQQVAGADAVSTRLAARLAAARVRAVITGEGQLGSAAAGMVEPQPVIVTTPAVSDSRPWRHWRYTVAAAGIVAVAVGGVAVERPRDPGERQADVPMTALVEGRVTIEVPADWTVRRVTDGPGSARVEVRAPAEPDVVLHLTQSRLSTADLAATATALRNAVDAAAPGVFVDFNPADTRAGRRAVTYREVRPGRDIGWTVLVDGDLRISVGCQHATGRAAAVAAACDDAVRSARRVR